MRKIIEQSSPNPSKTMPKSFQNREKSKKIDKTSQDDIRSPKNTKKMRKIAKNDPTWAQEPPKGRTLKSTPGLRVGLSGFLNYRFKSIYHPIQPRWGGTPAHCDASRISAGVQFISSAAARPNHAKHIQNLSIP